MLKAVSSVANAVGALNYKGTWNATTNSPALASGSGTKGDYYVVSVAGTTTLDGISNWGVGDWAVFNGSVWQRVEGGADLNGVNLSVTGTTTLSGLTASTALALDASNNVVSVTNTGTGNNVLATSPSIATPTLTGDVQMSTGNLVVGTAGKGIDFSGDPSAPGMTSELLDDYEEGTWTPSYGGTTGDPTVAFSTQAGYYTRVGRIVYCHFRLNLSSASGGTGSLRITGLPFTPANLTNGLQTTDYAYRASWTTNGPDGGYIINNSAFVYLIAGANTGITSLTPANLSATAQLILSFTYTAA